MSASKSRSLALAAALTVLGACSGNDGATGPQGPAGADGAAGATGATGANGQNLTATAKPESCEVCHGTVAGDHQGLFNSFTDGLSPRTSKLVANIVSVVTSNGTNTGSFKSTVTFTLTDRNGVPYLGTLAQKTMFFVAYDGAGKFLTPPYVQDAATDPTGEKGKQDPTSPVNFSYGSLTLTDRATGTYTMVKDNLSADPLTANANAFVYGYFGDASLPIPVKPTTHYTLMDNVASVAKVVAGTVDYASTANVSGCEKCHPAPYSKHGYRQAHIAKADDTVSIPDFAACKACHNDGRRGTDGGWYLLVDDRATYAATNGTLTDAQKLKYAYTANLMNDVHNSHAFEFAYPQSMANCATCHAGKLDRILTPANFNLTTCKSCHPVTAAGGTEPGRAPALATVIPSFHGFTDLYNYTGPACTTCHQPGAAKTFDQIHTGYDKAIYADAAGTKYSSSIEAQVDSASFDAASNKLTVNFSVAGAAAGAVVKPTVVVSLYGYDTKDFIVSGHGTQADGTSNLEWTEGATQRGNPTKSSNSARLTVVPGTAALSWVATADLTTWASKLADGSVKRVEIGVLPSMGLNQSAAPQPDSTKAGYNPYIAIAGVTKTFDLVAKALVADSASYGRNIVDPVKCNSCHDALATTFHTPNYGSAGVVACRLCHVAVAASAHLEQQSRSIDSFVHAIHMFQAMDVGSIDFTNAVQKLDYDEHIDSTYPQFTTLNCESCHNPGTYGAPDQSRSLPGVLAASATLKGRDRNIGTVPSYVTGPASRACGGCHRAEMINEDDAGKLAAFDAHADTFGYMLDNTNPAGVLDGAIQKIMGMFK